MENQYSHKVKIAFVEDLARLVQTNQIIFNKTSLGDPFCVFYIDEEESLIHLFFDCDFVKVVAFGSAWGCKLYSLNIRNTK